MTLYSSAATDLIADVYGYVAGSTEAAAPVAGGAFAGPFPTRILDTRHQIGTTGGRLAAGATLTVQVTGAGAGGVPVSRVAAVVLTLPAVNPSSAGYLSAYPRAGSRPNVSNVNYGAQQTLPNLLIVPLNANGTITISTTSAADVLADVTGYVVQ